MAHVFFRIAASDFLIHRQRRGQRRFFAIGAGVDLVHRPAGEQLRRRSGRRARFQYLNHPSAPFGGGGLILDIRVNAVEQAFAAQFGQLVVKIFAGLAEEFIGGIAEAKHGKCGIGQLRRFLRKQELMQRNGFFRRLTFALRRRHHDQQLFGGNLFEFIVACVNQLHVQLRGLQIVAQRFSHAAGVAGLRCRNQGDGRNFRRLGWRDSRRAGLLIQRAPEVTRNPGQLGGREVGRGRLKARHLLRTQR